ncbi:MAG: hypothetical protein C0490_12360 [Marivirga sp.]|nr:hypothetical protein [Marivirga sp.]
MKKTIIAIAALSLILTAFKTNTMELEKKKRISSSEQMAERVVAALKESSADEYAELFPSLSEFKDMMKESSGIYGSHLNEAQLEFASNYENKLIPPVKRSFDELIWDGKNKGIDWSSARYVGIELGEQPQYRFSPVPVTIVISSNGKEHRIKIEKALVINGQWNVSQFVTLI